MMRLISSPVALEVVLALSQRREGARLAELAAAIGTSLSTAQAATNLLVADGVVERRRAPRPLYRLRQESPVQDALLTLATRYPSPQHALDVVLRASPAVEFAARDRAGYLAVEAALADPRDLVLLEEALHRIGGRGDVPRVERIRHDEVIERLRHDRAPRARVRRATLLKGSLARSFPERGGHARPGRLLRRPHPRLGRISRRALAALARVHGLRRIRLFGSAVRADFRPESDVDVLVEPRAGPLSLFDLARLETDLERLLERHADVLTPGGLRDDVRARVEREAVTLYG